MREVTMRSLWLIHDRARGHLARGNTSWPGCDDGLALGFSEYIKLAPVSCCLPVEDITW